MIAYRSLNSVLYVGTYFSYAHIDCVSSPSPTDLVVSMFFEGAETNRGEKGFHDSVVLMLGGREERGVLEARKLREAREAREALGAQEACELVTLRHRRLPEHRTFRCLVLWWS